MPCSRPWILRIAILGVVLSYSENDLSKYDNPAASNDEMFCITCVSNVAALAIHSYCLALSLFIHFRNSLTGAP